jgi:hypothetical protein
MAVVQPHPQPSRLLVENAPVRLVERAVETQAQWKLGSSAMHFRVLTMSQLGACREQVRQPLCYFHEYAILPVLVHFHEGLGRRICP